MIVGQFDGANKRNAEPCAAALDCKLDRVCGLLRRGAQVDAVDPEPARTAFVQAAGSSYTQA